MKIVDHLSLRDISWFKTGGVTEHYAECNTLDDVISAITQAKELGVSYRIIGDSSNVLMSDSGFPGLIIRNKTQTMVFIHDRSQVIVDAGVSTSLLLSRAASLGYSGLEFLAGIPGTIGGAVYGNATALGCSISDYVRSATLLLASDQRISHDLIRRVERSWFEFSPRSSKLKRMQSEKPLESMPIILSITLQLSHINNATCTQRVNAALHARKERHYTKHAIIEAFCTLRYNRSIDTPLIFGRKENVLNRHYHMIEKSTVRHWRVGELSVLPVEPNFIINHGYGTSRDAAGLIKQIQEEVSTEKQLLESHVDYVGLWD